MKTGIKKVGIQTTVFLLMVICILPGCKKDILQQTVYDNVVYEVNPVAVYASGAEKTKQKSAEQFVSILYSNLTNQTIPGDAVNNIAEVTLSFGDKGLMNQMLLENFLNSVETSIPSATEMRNDIDTFVKETYLKFYLRNPTEYEKYYFRNLLEKDTDITPEMVYASFAESNEYLFY